ncbi:hypothetical protein CPB84DRAFT_167665 [Gymnopilus junonius]|uniref:Uncharacterized protein n=1 Tax=Gymnopilus junonius TaxID=109634 RepID=A0A9P5TRG0_GYMJU|nr:hypothetical protein CPB84DRAFT_167665 [Gymnopilus junonius]
MHIQDHDAASNIIKDIVQCSDRWHILDLECYNDSFSYFAGQVQSASALYTLRLSILDPPLDDCVLKLANARPTEIDLSSTLLKSIDINWDRATSVRLRGPRLNECFQLLTLAPQLKRYTLSAIIEPEAGHAAPSVPITHHAIQELILEDSTNDLIQLLNMISFPSLQTLSYEGWDQLNPEVLHFLARSSCLLRELTISKPYSFLYGKLPLFTPSLREIPSLRKFECFSEIESVAANDILAFLAGTFTENGSNPQGAFLPNLEHLKITVSPSKEIEWQ